MALRRFERGGRNRIGRREKWPKKSWEEGEIGGKSREEGEKEKETFREEGDIGSKSREEGDLPPRSTRTLLLKPISRNSELIFRKRNPLAVFLDRASEFNIRIINSLLHS